MSASRKIEDLSKELQSLFVRFDVKMKEAGIDYIVTCTWRSPEEQEKLYAQGRTIPGMKVTNARAGQSRHNDVDEKGKPASSAFDICIMKNGKPDWSTANPDWKRAGEIGKRIGLEWAGDWVSFREYPHFQLSKGKK